MDIKNFKIAFPKFPNPEIPAAPHSFNFKINKKSNPDSIKFEIDI